MSGKNQAYDFFKSHNLASFTAVPYYKSYNNERFKILLINQKGYSKSDLDNMSFAYRDELSKELVVNECSGLYLKTNILADSLENVKKELITLKGINAHLFNRNSNDDNIFIVIAETAKNGNNYYRIDYDSFINTITLDDNVYKTSENEVLC